MYFPVSAFAKGYLTFHATFRVMTSSFLSGFLAHVGTGVILLGNLSEVVSFLGNAEGFKAFIGF